MQMMILHLILFSKNQYVTSQRPALQKMKHLLIYWKFIRRKKLLLGKQQWAWDFG